MCKTPFFATVPTQYPSIVPSVEARVLEQGDVRDTPNTDPNYPSRTYGSATDADQILGRLSERMIAQSRLLAHIHPTMRRRTNT